MAKQKKIALNVKRGSAEGSQRIPTKSWGVIFESLGESFIKGFFDLLGKFGLAGILLLILYWFLSTNATDGQKQEIIDRWILFKDVNQKQNITLVGIGITLVSLGGQWAYYMRRLRMQREEITRLLAEKSVYQLLALGRKRKKIKHKK